VTIEEFLAQHSADALRMMVLNSGYRSPLTFNDEVIGQAERALERLRSALKPALPDSTGAPQASLAALQQQMQATQQGYVECMDDDINTAGALGFLFELVRVINQTRADGATAAELKDSQDLLHQLAGVLGLRLQQEKAADQAAAPFIDLLVELRMEMRKQKLYALSDQVRNRLAELGVLIEDSKEGSSWSWK
jgi:cysteinyl-tRNA synthetase